MRIPHRNDPRPTTDPLAADDASRFATEARVLVERAKEVQWYVLPGNDVDRAALALCRLRRAMAGSRGGPQHGDEAVRAVLAQASPDALVWIASRAVSYLDENGFPDAVGLWFSEEAETG